MIDRELIDLHKSRFPVCLLDRLDCANPEVRSLPHWMAPPPPKEEHDARREEFRRLAMSTTKARQNGNMASRKANKRRHAETREAKGKPARATMPVNAATNKPKFQPSGTTHHKQASLNGGYCPRCGHDRSQSKGYLEDGRRRRRCSNADCGHTFIVARVEDAGAAA